MALDRCAVSLTGLADDVLLSCLSFVAGEDLCRLSQTCTRLQQQLHSQAAFVWRRALQQEFASLQQKATLVWVFWDETERNRRKKP